MACEWASKNKLSTLWGGCSFQDIVEAVSHQHFDQWVGRLKLTDAWADVAFLHALACSVGADVLLVEAGAEPAKLLGLSLMAGDHDSSALVPLAMHDHYHFWPLVPAQSCPTEQVCLTLSPGSENLDWDVDYDTLAPSEFAVGGREQELQLCEALVNWSPFELPTQSLIECLQSLG